MSRGRLPNQKKLLREPLGRNALSMKLEVKDCFVQAANLFDVTTKTSIERQKKALEGPTKGHITVYPDKGWARQ